MDQETLENEVQNRKKNDIKIRKKKVRKEGGVTSNCRSWIFGATYIGGDCLGSLPPNTGSGGLGKQRASREKAKAKQGENKEKAKGNQGQSKGKTMKKKGKQRRSKEKQS